MYSSIRKRLTYANVAMTVALVFAMSGAAFAAGKYLITSTKQISPKVLKSLQGKKGAAGATGPAGPAGSTGPAGPAGAKGETGPPGKEGAPGKEGTPGKEGAPGGEGKEGSPWTASGTLPSGKTETGLWSVATKSEALIATVSFTLPLTKALGEAEVHYVEGNGNGTTCPGTTEKPQAAPGNLCVYQTAGSTSGIENVNQFATGVHIFPVPLTSLTQGSGPSGAQIRLKKEASAEEATGYGSWAVTEK